MNNVLYAVRLCTTTNHIVDDVPFKRCLLKKLYHIQSAQYISWFNQSFGYRITYQLTCKLIHPIIPYTPLSPEEPQRDPVRPEELRRNSGFSDFPESTWVTPGWPGFPWVYPDFPGLPGFSQSRPGFSRVYPSFPNLISWSWPWLTWIDLGYPHVVSGYPESTRVTHEATLVDPDFSESTQIFPSFPG